MPSPGEYRNKLHAWFARTGRTPPYKTYPDGRDQFVCVLSSPKDGIKTEGRGLRKSEAEEEAARAFVEQLRRSGKWTEGNAPRPAILPTPAVSDGPLSSGGNPKTLLNVYLQNTLRVSNPGKYSSCYVESGRFKCQLDVDLPSGRRTFTADGPSKTEAEKTCAREALATLQRWQATIGEGPSLLRRAASLPPCTVIPPAPRQKWNPRRPEPSNPCSLLNEFLQQNAIGNAGYQTSGQQSDGKFKTSCTIDLKDQGRRLHQSATGDSKSESKKKCAEKLIDDLEKLQLIDVEELRQSPTVSDNVPSENSSVEQILSNSESLPRRSSLSNVPGATAAPLLTTDAVPTSPCMSRRTRRPSLTALFGSSEEVNDRQILLISKHIGKFRKTIGLELGLSEADIDNCVYKEDDPYEVNRRILRRWRQRMSSNATVGKLCSVLWECKAYDAVEELHKKLRDAQ